MLQTEGELYDGMSNGQLDPSKWKVLSFPMGNGEMWTWAEPKARIESREGGLALTVDPFTRKHDTIHMFDDPKQLYASTRSFPVSLTGVTVFVVEMGALTYRSSADDIRDAFAGFINMDFSTGMIFDFVTTGRKVGVIYERLLIPGVTDEKTAFTYLIENPFSGVRTEPGKLHRFAVRIDAPKGRAEWQVDGKPFFKAEGIPVPPKEIMMGWGLFTLKPIDPQKGSTSSTARAQQESGEISERQFSDTRPGNPYEPPTRLAPRQHAFNGLACYSLASSHLHHRLTAVNRSKSALNRNLSTTPMLALTAEGKCLRFHDRKFLD